VIRTRHRFRLDMLDARDRRGMPMDGPLDGVKVLEVANWLAAPATATLLSDMGAAVIKVEPPQGDAWRYAQATAGKLSSEAVQNPAFQLDNRGKRSIAVDLGHPEGRSVVHRLAAGTDVLITNLVPSRIERYGLGYTALSATNPRLIYAAVNAYGAEGEERDRLGFDYTGFWARSGLMSLVGDRDAPPAMPRAGMGDHTTALALTGAILAALYARERTGAGEELRASLLNTGLWVLGSDLQAALLGRQAAPAHARAAPRNPIQNSYRARDGRWLLLYMAQADRDWPRACAALGLDELATDPRYSSMAARQEHSTELVAALDAAFAGRTRDEWAERLDAYGLMWAPIQTVSEILDDPQVQANGYFAEIEHPTLGRFRTVDTPVRYGSSHVGVRGPAPEVGQHTEEILLEQGLSWEEIARLREIGAVGPLG
jgi:crotonobetainyl-CoA:carnitine CoA-transferase CaiB-like acyl-CoA transferase